jgi:hypothetical protein
MLQASGGLLEGVAQVVIAERGQDHAQRVGLVVECRRARGKDALARCAVPELHDLDFLLACAAPGEVAAAAVRATLRDL